jgi:hypothetical protein
VVENACNPSSRKAEAGGLFKARFSVTLSKKMGRKRRRSRITTCSYIVNKTCRYMGGTTRPTCAEWKFHKTM